MCDKNKQFNIKNWFLVYSSEIQRWADKFYLQLNKKWRYLSEKKIPLTFIYD